MSGMVDSLPRAWLHERTQSRKGSEPVEFDDPAVVVHEQAGRAALGDHAAAPSSGPATNAALASTSARHASPATTVTDASPLRRRASGPRIDEVVQRRAVAAATRDAAGCSSRSRPRASASMPGRAGVERVVDRDHPAVRFGRVTERAEVAAEVDEHAARAGVDELARDEVGGVALADAAEVERDAGGQRDGAHDAGRARCRRSPGPVPARRAGPAPSAATASKSRSYPAATTAGRTVGS